MDYGAFNASSWIHQLLPRFYAELVYFAPGQEACNPMPGQAAGPLDFSAASDGER